MNYRIDPKNPLKVPVIAEIEPEHRDSSGVFSMNA
jgi:hypothetical protein